MRMRRQRRGANAVEFALVAPVLFMVIAGIMEYSWLLFNQIMLDAAAREGARVGAWVEGDPSAVKNASVSAAEDFWDKLKLPGEAKFDVDNASSQGHDLLIVVGRMPYPGLIGFYTVTPENLETRVAARREL